MEGEEGKKSEGEKNIFSLDKIKDFFVNAYEKVNKGITNELTAEMPGELHDYFFEELKKTDNGKVDEISKKFQNSSANTIKTSPFIALVEKQNLTSSEKIKNIKEETLYRISAYTSDYNKEWYTLAYPKEQELEVGLGDILLDPDIKEILVQKGNEIIKGHRGKVMKGNHAGLTGFLDDNGDYIATFSGDKFRILSGDKSSDEEYLKMFEGENKLRKEYVSEMNYESDSPDSFNEKSTNKSTNKSTEFISETLSNESFVEGKDSFGNNVILRKMAMNALNIAKSIAEKKTPPVKLNVVSSYRSISQQKDIWDKAVKKYGSENAALKWAAKPGVSPHQTGGAMDIIAYVNGKGGLTHPNQSKYLKSIMEEAGFENYDSEPWHWEIYTKRWKQQSGNSGSIYPFENNLDKSKIV
jgi:D-alanyl-D-alanine dipeptidase